MKKADEYVLEYYYRVFTIFIELKQYKSAKKAADIILEQYVREYMTKKDYEIVLSVGAIGRMF